MATLAKTSAQTDPLADMKQRLGRRGTSNIQAVMRHSGAYNLTVSSLGSGPQDSTSLPPIGHPSTKELPPNGNLSHEYRTGNRGPVHTTSWHCPENYWHIAKLGRFQCREQTPRGRCVARNLASTLYHRGIPAEAPPDTAMGTNAQATGSCFGVSQSAVTAAGDAAGKSTAAAGKKAGQPYEPTTDHTYRVGMLAALHGL
mmetsp:Transcript_77545/g.146327  ORF Transcript_77545/g.146327 Transcript_77545/m.146327 type:complete len:200 (-) Transcript_77545:84-683(-)